MMTKSLISTLLLALAAGIATHARAAGDEPTALSPQACQALQQELDAMAAHVRAARASGAAQADAPYPALAQALEAHLDALKAGLPTPATQRAQAGELLSDMRDALVLVRGATHLEARLLAVQRLEDDRRLYNRVLETLGCSATRPTAL
ncbi:hypothetical protein [Thauera sp. SWB20]|uniref:hypothetical protein n=1 Tax=Thauera sp. SWB20 TaxID=1572758 RepID=UPI0005ADAFB6|nr:hypothetical protein [Thauera sp. SWB20]KIN91665.1 hypothetical protein PO78_3838 [Thauera sp. SWB20]